MSKTPDEIKKGLECCITDKCRECPYYPLYEVFGCKLARAKDTLALIQQLEAERDAAVKDIRLAFTSYVGTCQTCKYGENQVDCVEPVRCGDCEIEKCKCQSCDSNERNWEWRGVQKD